jgi:hypothetical protein
MMIQCLGSPSADFRAVRLSTKPKRGASAGTDRSPHKIGLLEAAALADGHRAPRGSPYGLPAQAIAWGAIFNAD